jgi:preprotein translocase subunit SecF
MRNINFTGMFSKSTLVSIALVVGAAVILITKGLNYGVDFRGGAEIQVRFTESIELQGIRDSLNKGGFKASSVQQIGDNANNEFMIKLQASEENINEVTEKVTATLKSDFATSGFEIRKTDIVGPKAGEQLRISGSRPCSMP